MDDSARLFGKKTKKDWMELRERLKIDFTNEKDWNQAADLMRKRFQTRYFTPIEHILSLNITNGEGFAVMTLMCSLIEFFQSCIEGKNYELYAEETDFVYGSSSGKFKAFLLNEDPFKEVFIQKLLKPKKKLENIADDFYSNVRCGLLHEASTKNNWVIRTSKKSLRSTLPFIDITNQDEKIIYRDLFYTVLKSYSTNYLAMISSSKSKKSQLNFCRKMDSLCEIFNDTTVPWWKS
jgi:hypothetical protein